MATTISALHLGSDMRWPEDFWTVAKLVLQLAILHCIAHRFVFMPLARYCIPSWLGNHGTSKENPKEGKTRNENSGEIFHGNPSTTYDKDEISQELDAENRRPWTPPPSPSPDSKRKLSPSEMSRNIELDIKRRKFSTSCYKLTAYAALFALGMHALLMDDQLTAKMSPSGQGWLSRGPISNFDDWPNVWLRYPDGKAEEMANQHQTELAARVSTMWTACSQWLLSGNDSKKAVGHWLSAFVLPDVSAATSLSFMTKDATSSLWWTFPENTEQPKQHSITSPIVFLYQCVLAFYIWTSFLLAFDLEGPRQKDKFEMLLHHFVTMFLVVFSWYFKLFRIGAFILVLHDMSDPFMDIAKLLLYSGKQGGANISFACFAISFLVGRCIVFPMTIVWPAIAYLLTEEGWAKAQLLPGWYFPLAGLLILQGLHIFWGALIVRMVVDAVTKGDVGDDIRDEE